MVNFEWIAVVFWIAVVTEDFLTASNNDMKLVETRTLQFASLKLSFCFVWENKQTRERFLVFGKFKHYFVCPLKDQISAYITYLERFRPMKLKKKRVQRWQVSSWIRCIASTCYRVPKCTPFTIFCNKIAFSGSDCVFIALFSQTAMIWHSKQRACRTMSTALR